MAPHPFTNFFVASVGAAAALVGLLFVAVSVAPERTVTPDAPFERQAVAASAFTALLNAFFISLSALIPDTNLGGAVLVVGVASLCSSLLLGWELLHRSRGLIQILRRSSLIVTSLGLYGAELVLALQFLGGSGQVSTIAVLVRLLVGVYALAVLRSWELLGARRYSLLGFMSALRDVRDAPPSTADESDR